MRKKSDYIQYADELSEDGYKLICIHHAGGGASTFINWQENIRGNAEVIPIQLPGHENLIRYPFVQSVDEAVSKICDAVKDYIKSNNYSVFGHSMGGIIAFELAKRLESEGIYPDKCFISATKIEKDECLFNTEDMDDEKFSERVFAYGGIDESCELFQYPEYRALYMKIFRADFSIIDKYKYDGIKLRCPIEAFCGKDDPMENIEDMHSWEQYTESEVGYTLFDGGHFYFNENCSEICDVIVKKIRKSNDVNK